jgi:hypothetical protein
MLFPKAPIPQLAARRAIRAIRAASGVHLEDHAAAGIAANAHFPRPRDWNIALPRYERSADLMNDHRAHFRHEGTFIV